MASEVARYFARRYPKRESLVGSGLFRVGEAERRRVVRDCCGPTEGLHLLDMGCGDGRFLATVLQGRPASVTLVDLSRHNLAAAQEALRPLCDDIRVVEGDARSLDLGRRFDRVLAIGVLDYWPEWRVLLGRLAAATTGRLVLSLPPTGVPRHLLRRVWLRTQGIRLQTVSAEELRDGLRAVGCEPHLLRTKLEWFACADAAGGESGHAG